MLAYELARPGSRENTPMAGHRSTSLRAARHSDQRVGSAAASYAKPISSSSRPEPTMSDGSTRAAPVRPAARGRAGNPSAELAEHRFRARHVEAARRLDEKLAHLPVLHQHGIALGPRAHAEPAGVHLEADGAGELAVPVRDHADLTAGIVLLAPGPHDEGVVHRQAEDLVHALLADVACLVDAAGKVLHRAGWGEGAGDGEEHNRLPLRELAHGHLLRARISHLHELHVRGQRVTGLDRHGPFLLV